MSHVTERRPRLAVTLGDPAGIGPEIIAKLCAKHRTALAADLLVIGSPSCVQAAAAAWAQLPVHILDENNLGSNLDVHSDAVNPDAINVVAITEPRAPIQAGVLSADAGKLAYLAIEKAVALAMRGDVDAIVTAPINKEALSLAGYRYPGHTEILAKLSGSADSCMLLVHERLKVSHVSTHTALRNVPDKLTAARLERVIHLTYQAMQELLDIATPRLAVAALNPHAGEDGLFGDEDLKVTAPVVADFQAKGMNVVGPIPGDTVFVKAYAGQYDAVIAMYHDQGHIPLKLLGFSIDADGVWQGISGVNVTLGLPIIRTSVDHGTAFDIAGKGVANEQSLLEASELALRFAKARQRITTEPTTTETTQTKGV